jgi:hypothetical protein
MTTPSRIETFYTGAAAKQEAYQIARQRDGAFSGQVVAVRW